MASALSSRTIIRVGGSQDGLSWLSASVRGDAQMQKPPEQTTKTRRPTARDRDTVQWLEKLPPGAYQLVMTAKGDIAAILAQTRPDTHLLLWGQSGGSLYIH